MALRTILSEEPRRRPRVSSAEKGMTLVETMVALGVLALTSFGGIVAFSLLNQYAASTRNTSSAKALCQERIEQATALPFHPPLTLPTVPSSIPTNPPTNFAIFGVGTLWSTDTPPYTNGSVPNYTFTASPVQTSTEPVNVYVQQDGVTATVAGTRTTTITSKVAALGAGAAAINVPTVLFTAQVTYTYRGSTKTYAMSTLRASD